MEWKKVVLILFLFVGMGDPQFFDRFIKFPRPSVRTLRFLPLKNEKVTLSGSSSGGAFAMQLYLAYSKLFSGVAIFSGGAEIRVLTSVQFRSENILVLVGLPVYFHGLITLENIGLLYRCVEANRESFSGILGCINGLTNLTTVVDIAEELASDKLIDKLKYLKFNRHYVEHGYNDEKFSFNNGRQIAQFFGEYSSNVRYQETSAIHGIATDNCGFTCGSKLYLNSGCLNCGRSAVYQGLSYIRKKRLYRTESRIATCYQGKAVPGLYKFDQTEFFRKNILGVSSIPMERYGYIYIPPRCEADSELCTLHVAFHDCSTMQIFGGVPWHITCSGYLEVAAANNIIVLFPQATIQYSDPYSYLGCWDFVGYTGELYGTKRGSQVRAVYKMIKRLITAPRPDFDYYDY